MGQMPSVRGKEFGFFVCQIDTLHPYECDGPGLCPACPRPRTDLTPEYVAMKLQLRKQGDEHGGSA